MNANYKFEIVEKMLQFCGLLYFVIGFFATYAWACKELDYISPRKDIYRFWNPIAIIMGCMNIFNFILMIYAIYKSKKITIKTNDIENKVLFYILCVPLFIVSLVYSLIEVVKDGQIIISSSKLSIFIPIGELCLFCGTMSIIVNINFKLWLFVNRLEKALIKFIMLMTLIGMVNHFIFHITTQQIHCFVRIASSYIEYSKYYNVTKINSFKYPFYFKKIRKYLLPLVILFCCTCIVYIVKFSFSKTNTNEIPDTEEFIKDSTEKENSDEDLPIEDINENGIIEVQKFPSFRLPPLSLVLGILLITMSLLVISIFDSLLNSEALYISSQFLNSIFRIPIDIVAIGLLYIQIKEMEKWSKLKKNKNIVDKTLIWVGAIGQLIIAFSQIELCYFTSNNSLSAVKIISNVILIIQTATQTITISLALERKWIPPERKSWQEYICPAVGLLSVNLSFLIFNVYIVMGDVLNHEFKMEKNTLLFVKLFGTGFHSLGETLGILQRLHSSLIFVKMIVFTNN